MARGDEDLRSRLLRTFRGEAEEHLQGISANLASLERGLSVAEAAEVVEATFRQLHTLKGAARSVSLLEVEGLCQACESVFSRLRRGELPLTGDAIHTVQQAMDAAARLIEGGEAPERQSLIDRLDAVGGASAAVADTGEPAAAPPVAPLAADLRPIESIRLTTAELDALFVQAEDFLVPKLSAEERIRDGQALLAALGECRAAAERALEPAGSEPRARGVADLRKELQMQFRLLEGQAGALVARLTQDHRGLAGSVDALQTEMRRLRMTPAAAVLDLLPRMARDLAREHGKEVEWSAQGADLEVDRRVLDALRDPLTHLVRNAVGHGIEIPAERVRTGKPPRGRIGVTVAALEGNRVAFWIADDGAGIDAAKVRAAAIRSRLLPPEAAQTLTEEASVDLIFQSGLSTSPIITSLAGHGLGLAIVKERVEALGGQMQVETFVGAGTTVRMVVPSSIATFRGLLLRAGEQQFLLPIAAAERAIRIAPEAVQSVEGRDAISWNGLPVPIQRLSAILGLPDPDVGTNGDHLCVIARVGDDRAGLIVDEIVGDREVLAKEMTAPLVRVPNLAGAGLLGTGQIVLILRPRDLIRAARERRPPAPSMVPARPQRLPSILVVDDSITTRTMEKNLLEAEGYQVRVAVDGMDAWTLLKTEEFDLVLSDVDMPRLDGFDLTERIRADAKLAALPVVLVTALESREDQERGITVGANAYVVKSTFDRSNLLGIIRRML